MKKKRSTRLANRRRNHFVDFITIVICLAGIAGALYCFQNLIYKSLANESDVPVGIITFKKKSPRRRLERENVWEYLKLKSTIYKGDYILTEDLSEAQLIFKDDNYIIDDVESNISHVVYNSDEIEQIKTGSAEIHPNSMMRVGEDNLLHFISGSVSLNSGAKQNNVSIRIGEDLYVLKENSSALFSLSGRISEEGMSTATVYCSSGEVSQLKNVDLKDRAQALQQTPENIISSGQTFTVQVKPEKIEAKPDDSILPKSVRDVAKKGLETTKNAAAAVTQRITGRKPDVQEVSEQSGGAGGRKPLDNRKASAFNVLVPPKDYSITQNKKIKESIPFYWTNTNSIKVEFSYNANFASVIDTEHFTSAEKRSAVILDFASPGDVIYWRAVEGNKKYSDSIIYPSGKIIVNDPEKKNLKNSLIAAYGQNRADEIEKIVQENQKLKEQNIERQNEILKTVNSQAYSQVLEEIEDEEIETIDYEELRDLHSGKIAEEARKAEEERLAELKRIEDERKAEIERKKEEARKAEQARLAEKRRKEEAARKVEEAKKAEAARKAEEARKKEAARIAEEKQKIEEERLAEEKRKAEEEAARKAEEERLAEEKRKAEEDAARKAEEERLAEEKRKAEEEARKADEEVRKQEETRLAQEQKQKQEEARKAEEKRKAEEARKEEMARKKEEARKVAEERKAQREREKKEADEAEKARQAEEERIRREQEEIERKQAEEQARQQAEEISREAANKIISAFTNAKPVLSSPSNDKLFTENDFDSLMPKIDFTWQKVDGAKNYKFEIRDSSGKELISKTVSSNRFTLTSNDLSRVAENGEYTWSVKAAQTINKEEFTTQVAERTFRVQMDDAESATLNIDNLITF